MLVDVLAVFEEFVAEFLFEIGGTGSELGEAVDDVHGEVEAVEVVEDGHVEGGGDGAFFLVAADVEVVVVGAAIGEAVDEPGVAVEGEDDGLVFGEEDVEVGVGEAVGMFGAGLEFHEIDDVDDADFELWESRVGGW